MTLNFYAGLLLWEGCLLNPFQVLEYWFLCLNPFGCSDGQIQKKESIFRYLGKWFKLAFHEEKRKQTYPYFFLSFFSRDLMRIAHLAKQWCKDDLSVLKPISNFLLEKLTADSPMDPKEVPFLDQTGQNYRQSHYT